MLKIFGELSYPRVVFETQSKINGRIRIVEVGKTRKLLVGNFVESVNEFSPSCSKLYWGYLVDLVKEQSPDAKKVLVLGLGGGTIVSLLSKKFPEIQIVSVELDPIIVDIAKKYFHIDNVPNHRIINDDALRVVVEPEEFDLSPTSFDVLIVDIYLQDQYPDLGKTGNFLGAIKRLVVPGGLIVINRIYTVKHQEDVNNFIKQVEGFLSNVDSKIIAGYTNSDNILIYGRV